MTRTNEDNGDTVLDVYVPLGGGTGYVGAGLRTAMFRWAYGGHTDVLLETYDGLIIQGWCEQGEKAEGLCQRWIETGLIASMFNETDRLDLREVQP